MTNNAIDWNVMFPGSENLTDYVADEISELLSYNGEEYQLSSRNSDEFATEMAEALATNFYEHAFKDGVDAATDEEYEILQEVFKAAVLAIYNDAYSIAVERVMEAHDDYLERAREYERLVLG